MLFFGHPELDELDAFSNAMGELSPSYFFYRNQHAARTCMPRSESISYMESLLHDLPAWTLDVSAPILMSSRNFNPAYASSTLKHVECQKADRCTESSIRPIYPYGNLLLAANPIR